MAYSSYSESSRGKAFSLWTWITSRVSAFFQGAMTLVSSILYGGIGDSGSSGSGMVYGVGPFGAIGGGGKMVRLPDGMAEMMTRTTKNAEVKIGTASQWLEKSGLKK